MNYDVPQPFRRALPWTALVAYMFLLNYMSRSMLSPLLVHVEEGIGVGHAAASSLLLMQSVGFSISVAVSGFTLAYIRPRYMAGIPLALSGLVLVAMPLVQTLDQARLLFLLFGLGAGVYFPAGMSTLSSLVFPEDWGKAVAIHELAPNTGFILIPLVAQLALLATDWRGTFACIGAVMVVSGFAFALWGRGGSSYTPPPSFNGCARLLRNPAAWGACFILITSVIGEFAIFSILHLFLVSDGIFSAEGANVFLFLSRLLAPLVVLAGGWAADRWQVAAVVRNCFVLHAVALGLMSQDAQTMPILVLGGSMLQSMSIAFVFPSIFKLFAQCFSTGEQPILLSLCMPVAGLVATGGVPFFLGYCGEYLTFGTGFLIMAILSVLTAWSVSLLKNRRISL